MAYTGEAPWHRLGHEMEADATIEEWAAAAGMEWTVERAPVQFSVDDEMVGADGLVTYPSQDVLYRSDTHDPLSVVSGRYQIVQPKSVLEFYREFVEELGCYTIETAGCLAGGKRVWALAKGTNKVTLSKNDIVQEYLLFATSYDKTTATTIRQTSIRVVCQNTLDVAAAGKAKQEIRVTHLAKFDAAAIKKQMELSEHFEWYKKALKALSKKKVSQAAIDEYWKDVLFTDKERESRSEKGQDRILEGVQDIYAKAPGQDLGTAKGRVWGALNAVTYYADHVQRAHNDDGRLKSSWFGRGNRLKTRAFDKALQFAGVSVEDN